MMLQIYRITAGIVEGECKRDVKILMGDTIFLLVRIYKFNVCIYSTH